MSTSLVSRIPSVLVGAVRDGLGLLTWEEESFAFADSFDEADGPLPGIAGRAARIRWSTRTRPACS